MDEEQRIVIRNTFWLLQLTLLEFINCLYHDFLPEV